MPIIPVFLHTLSLLSDPLKLDRDEVKKNEQFSMLFILFTVIYIKSFSMTLNFVFYRNILWDKHYVLLLYWCWSKYMSTKISNYHLDDRGVWSDSLDENKRFHNDTLCLDCGNWHRFLSHWTFRELFSLINPFGLAKNFSPTQY